MDQEKKYFRKTFIWVLTHQIIIRGLIYAMALLPITLIWATPNLSFRIRVFTGLVALLAVPVIIVLIVGVILLLIPKIESGGYLIYSKEYYQWLRRNVIAEFISTSTFLNNFVHRIPLVKCLYYLLIGFKHPLKLIMAPDVKILDPGRCHFGEYNFIGYGTIIRACLNHYLCNLERMIVMNMSWKKATADCGNFS